MDLPLHVLIISSLIKIVVVVHLLLIGVMAMILAERKVSGWIQDRHGPNRVGPWGVLQPIADGVKISTKRGPRFQTMWINRSIYSHLRLFWCLHLVTCGVVPFGSSITISGYEIPLQIADINIGVLYILAITSLGVYGVVLGAWASNNKYSLLGGLRSSAQMISYELTLGTFAYRRSDAFKFIKSPRDRNSTRELSLDLEFPHPIFPPF